MIMLSATGVWKTFVLHLQGGVRMSVLEDASLELRAGECVALTGPSGAGKSTFLRALYGSYLVDRGEVLVRHRGEWTDISNGDPRLVLEVRRETLGYVSQFLRVVPRVAALEVVAEAGRISGQTEEQALAEAERLLLRLNIPRRLHGLAPATFSGGEQQRINLARGFIGRHPILLLDEPTASLDPENRNVVVTMIGEAKAAGVAIAGIFHDREVRDLVANDVKALIVQKDAA